MTAAPLIDLGLGTTVFPASPLTRRAVERQLDQGLPARYPPRGGLPALRAMLAERHSPAGRPDPRSVVVTCGATQAITVLLRVLCEAGDRVCLPDPGFPHYRLICQFLGLRPVAFPQPLPGRPFPVERLRAVMRDTSPRVVLFNSPSNPTGWIAAPEDLTALADLLAEQSVHVISDEVYDQLLLDGTHRSIAAHLEPEQVSTVHSFSKSLSMAGWRLGYLIAHPALARQAERAVWALTMGAPTAAQAAAAAGLLESPQALPARLAELRHRRAVLTEGLSAAGLPTGPPPPGGCFLWTKAAADADAGTLLADRIRAVLRIIVSDGRAFGERGAGWLRFSFGAATADIEEAARRLAGWRDRPAHQDESARADGPSAQIRPKGTVT